MLVTADGFFPALLGMLQLCVTAAFFQNFWAVQAAVDIPFAAEAKNAWLLCLLRPGMTAREQQHIRQRKREKQHCRNQQQRIYEIGRAHV